MILYEDYLDNGKMTQPYADGEEQLWEYLHYLDMLLESFLWKKGGISDRQAFSRGLVITEKEIKSYIETPPFLRETDAYDAVLAAQAGTAREHIKQRTELTGALVQLPLEQVKNTFSLNEYELLALLLALSVQMDVKYMRLFAFLQDDISQKLPTIGLLEALYNQISPENVACAQNLLDKNKMDMYILNLSENTGHTLLLTTLVLKPQMRSFLMGNGIVVQTSDVVLSEYKVNPKIPVLFKEQMDFLQAAFGKARKQRRAVFVRFVGKEGCGRCMLAGQLAYSYGLALLVLDLQCYLALSAERQREYFQKLLLYQRLHPGIIYIKHADNEQMSAGGKTFLSVLGEQLSGVLICLGTPKGEIEAVDELAHLTVEIGRTTEQQRLEMWRYLTEGVSVAEDVSLEELADCHELTFRQIEQVVKQAVEAAALSKDNNSFSLDTEAAQRADSGDTAKEQVTIDKRTIRKYLFQMNQNSFGELATRIPAVYDWNDIQLEDKLKEILQTACDRYKLRNRVGEKWGLFKKNVYGNGISILLYGPPGTGKTMAAQVVANEVGLPLYRVDLSRVYSKYIGETEKNLSVIFDRAKDANVILFFDEADALFSKRTEVGSSNDRSSNSETSYLLQKMEEYSGISILATNLYNNFDNAFLRRLTFAVHFEKPDEATRYRLWTTILPKEVPVSKSVNFKFLAERFELSGSNIKAILYNAVYMAAAKQETLSMEHIVRSMKYEFEKLGRMVNISDFGAYSEYLR